MSTLEAQLLAAQQQCAQAVQALERTQIKLSSTELLHKQHIASMADQEQQLGAERDTILSQTQLIEQLQDQVAAAQEEKCHQHEHVAALQDQLTVSAQILQSTKDMVQEQQTKVTAAKSLEMQQADAILNLEAQLNGQASLHLSTQVEQLQEELDASHAQSFQHATCIAELTSQLRQLQSKLTASHAQSLQDSACISNLHSQLVESKLAIHAGPGQDAKCVTSRVQQPAPADLLLIQDANCMTALKSELRQIESEIATATAPAIQDRNSITVLKNQMANATQAAFCREEQLQQQSAHISSMQRDMEHAAVVSQQEQAQALETIAVMQQDLSTFEADTLRQMLALRQHHTNALANLQPCRPLDIHSLHALQLMPRHKASDSISSLQVPQPAAMQSSQLQLSKQNLLQEFQTAMPDKRCKGSMRTVLPWPSSKLQLLQQQWQRRFHSQQSSCIDSDKVLQQKLEAKSAEVSAMQCQLTQQAKAAVAQDAEAALVQRQLAQQEAATHFLKQQLFNKSAEVSTLQRPITKKAQAAVTQSKMLAANTKHLASLGKSLSEALSDYSLVNRCLVTQIQVGTELVMHALSQLRNFEPSRCSLTAAYCCKCGLGLVSV